jgi:hypothetical protein
MLDELAKRGAARLQSDSRAAIAAFVMAQRGPEGGFRGRGVESDLYYTNFAVRTLVALDHAVSGDRLAGFLRATQPGACIDLAHLVSFVYLADLVGCDAESKRVFGHIRDLRTADGGFRERPGAGRSSAYGCFLAALAHESRGVAIPDEDRLLASVRAMSPSVTPAIAARIILMALLGNSGQENDSRTLIDRVSPKGGFKAAPLAPIPDLLSTATSLCALSATGHPVDRIRDRCMMFVESLWADSGGFRGHWADTTADCEYTWYALLSLGALSEREC